jgi:hypothetical protein
MNVFEKVVSDIGKGIVWPFTHTAKIIEFLDTALKDTPAVKTAVQGLLLQIGVMTKDGATAVTGDGLNIAADLTEVQDAQTLFTYIKTTFLPAIEKAYADFEADVKQPTVDSGLEVQAVSTAVDELQPGPGLHTVVAA